MMRLWDWHPDFRTAPRKVWVRDVALPRLAPVGNVYGDALEPVQSVVVESTVSIPDRVEDAHFTDGAGNRWFLNNTLPPNVQGWTEMSVSRYQDRFGVGWDVPRERASAFGPPPVWTLRTAAGVPVQVLRITHVYETVPIFNGYPANVYTFDRVGGDTGWWTRPPGTPANSFDARAVRASFRGRGGTRTAGWLLWTGQNLDEFETVAADGTQRARLFGYLAYFFIVGPNPPQNTLGLEVSGQSLPVGLRNGQYIAINIGSAADYIVVEPV